jgi:hypothetical protein
MRPVCEPHALRTTSKVAKLRTTVVVLALIACKSKGDRDRAASAEQVQAVSGAAMLEAQPTADVAKAVAPAAPPAPAATAPEPSQRKAGQKANSPGRGLVDDKPGVTTKTPEGPTRAWFPETFLFEPLVVTDDQGAAVVPVRVPDRLTTWRVLALAHSRTGAQGGAVTSFLGTLPTYVDPVVPPFLVRGDEVRLPIQIVNTTEKDVTGTLALAADNATLRGGGGPRTVAAHGSTLDAATLVADRAGTIKLRVGFGATDAVEKTIEVRPAGQPVTQSRSGTLAAPRSFTTPGTPGADPSTDRARLVVFPGALALLRSELAVSSARSGTSDDAYALLLAGKAAALLAALGDKADPAVLRDLAIVTAQRAIHAGRTLDVERAALLAEPALSHPDNPVLARLGARAVEYLAKAQRPDGTFAGATGWTLQRLLVVTAEATRAVATARTTSAERQRAMQVQARAAGAFARNAAQVQDGFTAAAILASGAASGELAETLRRRVRDAIKRSEDGAAYLEVGPGVVRGDGLIPGRVEATALAVLALDGDTQAPLPDLGTTLLGTYSIARGWGDGRVNLVAMQAVLALFKTPIPSAVTITLTMDDRPIVSGRLEGAKLRDVLALDAAAPGLAEPHSWKLTADPAVPGLGYALALDSWRPWPAPVPGGGLELAVPARVAATVGKPVDVTITAVAPAGIPLHIQHALPAGVEIDRPGLDAQVAAGAIERFVAADGALDVYVAALPPGKTFTLAYRAIATLAGTLHSGASLIEAGPSRSHVPPAQWTITPTIAPARAVK